MFHLVKATNWVSSVEATGAAHTFALNAGSTKQLLSRRATASEASFSISAGS